MSAKLAQGPGKWLGEKLRRLLFREPRPQETLPKPRPQTQPRPQPGKDPKRPVAGPLPDQEAQPGSTEAPPEGERAPADEPAPEEASQEDEKEEEDVCCDPFKFQYEWPKKFNLLARPIPCQRRPCAEQ